MGERGDAREERLAALERRVAQLEKIVAQQERGRFALVEPQGDGAAAAVTGGPAAGSLPYADYFVRLAVVCFVLVGALVLRVAALERLIDTELGTVLGLAYSMALLATSLWQRFWRRAAAHALVLQLCGALLAQLVVLETYHKSEIVSMPVATALMLLVALVGGGIGAWRNERVLTNVALTAGVVALYALGFAPQALAWRAAATVVLLATALVVAGARSWPELRAFTLGPVLLAGGLGAWLAGRRSHMPHDAGPTLLWAAAAVLVVVAASHVARSRRMNKLHEASWLPLTALWAYGLFVDPMPEPAVRAAAITASLALLGAALAARRATQARLAVLGVGWAGVLLAGLSLPWLDGTGVSAAVVAAAALFVARALACDSIAVGGYVLALLAAAPSLVRIVTLPESGALGLTGASLLASAVLCGTYLLGRAPAEASEPWRKTLAPVALAGAIVVLFAALRLGASLLLGTGSAFGLTQTLLLAALSLLALRVGTALGLRDVRTAGFAGVGVLALKVVLRDLMGLEGPAKVAAVVTLGVVSLLVSLTMRKPPVPRAKPAASECAASNPARTHEA